jgi:hypothetical protein
MICGGGTRTPSASADAVTAIPANIEPDWTVEAAADPWRIVRDPGPKSRTGAVRIIGYSPSAGFVVTVFRPAGSDRCRPSTTPRQICS